jgi:AcrR family transcriptional regulator
MPKGFTEKERESIHQQLLERGREIFANYGVRKTSVEDLTRAVGISKGAFYIFFSSKEELFLEIMEQFEARFRETIFPAWNRLAGHPGRGWQQC